MIRHPSMHPSRRHFIAAAAAAGAATACAAVPTLPVMPRTAERLPAVRPPRLRPGDTLALVNPSGAIYERMPYTIAAEQLQALGFKVREAPHLRARYGHLAGTDEQRAGDINALFADASVHGILAVTGGSGGNRILPLIDYEAVRRTPKFFGGYSDLTALVNAIQLKTGLVTFHCPMAASEFNDFSVRHLRGAVMDGQALLLTNPQDREDSLVAGKATRTTTLRGGRARGPLVGGNLAVLTAMAGSAYWPVFDGAILFLEEVNEYIYRCDRMLSTLKLAGALERVAGVVVGQFTHCNPGEGYGTLTLDEVFDDYFKPLGVPVYTGAMFGHVRQKFTLPVGLEVELDADAASLRFLQPAVL